MENTKSLNVGILLYQGVEIIDFAGPAQVFSTAGKFNVFTIGLAGGPVSASNCLTVLPDYTLMGCPHLDVLVVPGGEVEVPLENKELMQWLKASTIKSSLVLSVCTGALLLARAGLLHNQSVTTYHSRMQRLKQMAPNSRLVPETRFVDSGAIITTAGLSAGIDGALHVVSRLLGKRKAQETAHQLEYPYWSEKLGVKSFS